MTNILRLDQSGMPTNWLSMEAAATAYVKKQVVWELGNAPIRIFGGHNRLGIQSYLELSPVIAISGTNRASKRSTMPLRNPLLFRRDHLMCMYCGNTFSQSLLTRDHVIPRVQGGKDCWGNVVSACQRCNHFKGGRTPEQAGMKLLAIPFEPNIFEFMYLANRKILGDQMTYLSSRFSGKRSWQAA